MKKADIDLEFEEVESNLAGVVWRAKVPSGWFVRITSDVISPNGDFGHEWRDSMFFYPDPNHEWGNKNE